jgi:hypothetical protein
MAFPFPTDLIQFIVWLSGPASLGVVQSFLLERLTFWSKLPSTTKQVIVFAVAQLLPIASAYALGHLNAETVAQAQTWVNLALQGLYVWFGSQVGHANNPYRPEKVVVDLGVFDPSAAQ